MCGWCFWKSFEARVFRKGTRSEKVGGEGELKANCRGKGAKIEKEKGR